MVSIAFGMFVAVDDRANSVMSQPTIPSTVIAANVLNCRLIGPPISTRAGSEPRAKPIGATKSFEALCWNTRARALVQPQQHGPIDVSHRLVHEDTLPRL